MNNDSQVDLKTIYAAIREEGFSERTINIINDYTYQILNGKTNLTQFTQAEHAGLCRAGEMLIGAYIVCNYAQASLAAGADAGASQAGPANWEIDEEQENLVQQWAEAKQVWYPNAEADIESEYGSRLPKEPRQKCTIRMEIHRWSKCAPPSMLR